MSEPTPEEVPEEVQQFLEKMGRIMELFDEPMEGRMPELVSLSDEDAFGFAQGYTEGWLGETLSEDGVTEAALISLFLAGFVIGTQWGRDPEGGGHVVPTEQRDDCNTQADPDPAEKPAGERDATPGF